jgi:hypothetical protein
MAHSYKVLQRRLAYIEQRSTELENVIKALDAQLRAQGVILNVPLSLKGVSGDQFLTDVNLGQMDMQLTNIRGLSWLLA